VSAARDEILARIRMALTDVPCDEDGASTPIPRDYRRTDDVTRAELVARFAERVRDYHAAVTIVPRAEIGDAILEACTRHGLRRLVVPPALPAPWRPTGVTLVEDHQLPPSELDAIDGAITGCAAAIAQTGTIILDGRGASGRRAITLVPDHHICLVAEDQIVGIVPEGIARVAGAATERRLPITLISGPSATSDIELERVEGVHGPRTLIVVIALEG
jgi:L-lactate dehydrogenase complex protein LldG